MSIYYIHINHINSYSSHILSYSQVAAGINACCHRGASGGFSNETDVKPGGGATPGAAMASPGVLGEENHTTDVLGSHRASEDQEEVSRRRGGASSPTTFPTLLP